MPRRAEDKTIKGNKYRVMQLPGREGSKVAARLVQLLGAGIAGMAKGVTDNDMKAAAFTGLSTLLTSLKEEQVDYFCNVFMPLTQVTLPDGKTPLLKDIFDDHFAGNYFEMFEWLKFCIEVNFGSFLSDQGGIESLLAQLMQAPQNSESPKGSTGGSGES